MRGDGREGPLGVLAALVWWGSGEFANLWLFGALGVFSSFLSLELLDLPREARGKFKGGCLFLSDSG